jgi:hypothetical protein
MCSSWKTDFIKVSSHVFIFWRVVILPLSTNLPLDINCFNCVVFSNFILSLFLHWLWELWIHDGELTFMDWFRNFNEKYLVNYSLVYIETRFKSSWIWTFVHDPIAISWKGRGYSSRNIYIDFVSGLACCVNKPHHNSLLSRLVVILVHSTGSTWYKVLYQHTMYIMTSFMGQNLFS